MTRSKVAEHNITFPVTPDSATVKVDLRHHSMPGRFEALPAIRVGPATYRVLVSPFFAYGIDRDDVVSGKSTDGETFFVAVVRKSGNLTIRVAFTDAQAVASLQPALHDTLEQMQLDHEWHASGYVAIDIRRGTDAMALRQWLDRLEDAGLVSWEFATPPEAREAPPRSPRVE